MKRISALAALALAIALILFGISFYRHRFVRRNSDLIYLLPPGDLNLIYADLSSFRKANLLGLFANIKVAPDRQYDEFIAATGFDYTRDLDAIAIAADPAQIFLIGHGRFHWDKLQLFARSHQGECTGDACRVRSTTPGRYVNFIRIQPDVLGVAIAPSETAADELRPPGRRVQETTPDAPLWAKLSHQFLTHPAGFPIPVQIFAISLQSATSVTLYADLEAIHLDARCPNPATADTARRQLEIQTGRLQTALHQTGEKPDRSSFAALLTAGSFQVVGNDVIGQWPLYPELLKALQ